MSKGEIGIKEVVELLILIGVIIVSLLIILAVKEGGIDNLLKSIDVPVFREWFK